MHGAAQQILTSRARIQAVFEGTMPDRVPHFELVFQMPDLAFGLPWPSKDLIEASTPSERDRLVGKYLDIWEKIIERYGWDAIPIDYSLYGHTEGKLYGLARERFPDVIVFGFNGSGTFWMPSGSEMVDFAVMLFERPQELHERARAKCAASIEYARRQVDEGVDFIVINSDYGFNEGPFINPKMFSEFVTPYLTEIVDAIHGFGVPAILHSDGDLREILDQLVSTGLDGYQSIDPQGHMDIAQVKRDYGERLVLMGNVMTALLQTVDEKPIRDAVRYAMESAKSGGRFIFSSSNCIFRGLPLESYDIMLNEYNKLAVYE